MIAAAPPASGSLEIRGVSRTFDHHVDALAATDLTIDAGDFVSVLGPSGCGKSTLLRIIAGLDRPTTGTITSTAKSVAYVFQDATLLPWRNVLWNVTLPLELNGISKTQSRDQALKALEQVGLFDAIDRYPAQLSGGMRMRVSLARALVINPDLLLLDEPFAALDEITRQHLDDQLRALWLDRGMTILFVTHSTTEASFLSQRAIVLSARPGKILLDHRVDLPLNRPASLRAEPKFAEESGQLFAALSRGGA